MTDGLLNIVEFPSCSVWTSKWWFDSSRTAYLVMYRGKITKLLNIKKSFKKFIQHWHINTVFCEASESEPEELKEQQRTRRRVGEKDEPKKRRVYEYIKKSGEKNIHDDALQPGKSSEIKRNTFLITGFLALIVILAMILTALSRNWWRGRKSPEFMVLNISREQWKCYNCLSQITMVDVMNATL